MPNPLQQTIEALAKEKGIEPDVVTDASRIRPAKSEVGLLLSQPSLAAELLDWRPGVSVRDGLARTIDWISQNQHSYRTGEYVT